MADRLECKASKDLLVRLGIGIALCIGMGVYCAMTPEPKPEVPFSENINAHLSWGLYVFGPWVGGLAALVLVGFWVRAFKRSLVADDKGLVINGKETIAWDAMAGLRAGQKGILYIDLKDGEPVELDRYQYRDFGAMVALLEERLSPAAPAAEAPAQGSAEAPDEDA
jgi:hypothetical protein